MAFMALGAGAAAFLAFFMAFMALGMVKGGVAKSACKMFDLTSLSQNGYGRARMRARAHARLLSQTKLLQSVR